MVCELLLDGRTCGWWQNDWVNTSLNGWMQEQHGSVAAVLLGLPTLPTSSLRSVGTWMWHRWTMLLGPRNRYRNLSSPCCCSYYYSASAFIIVPSNQLIATSSAECSICKPPSWSLLTGHSFAIADIVWTIPHLYLSDGASCYSITFATCYVSIL